MDEWVTIRDIKALAVYLKMARKPDAYDIHQDLFNLMHWLDLTSDGFAQRLYKEYPLLTMQELNLCCLQRMGYSWEEIAGIMKVKDETIRRYVYRVCNRLQILGNKKDFEYFISSY